MLEYDLLGGEGALRGMTFATGIRGICVRTPYGVVAWSPGVI